MILEESFLVGLFIIKKHLNRTSVKIKDAEMKRMRSEALGVVRVSVNNGGGFTGQYENC